MDKDYHEEILVETSDLFTPQEHYFVGWYNEVNT